MFDPYMGSETGSRHSCHHCGACHFTADYSHTKRDHRLFVLPSISSQRDTTKYLSISYSVTLSGFCTITSTTVLPPRPMLRRPSGPAAALIKFSDLIQSVKIFRAFTTNFEVLGVCVITSECTVCACIRHWIAL